MGRLETQVLGSFILRITRKGEEWRFLLQNIRTGERLEFDSHQELQRHLDRLLRQITR